MAEVRGAILGLDPGERRIGVALSPGGTSMAIPLTVLDRSSAWLEALGTLAAEHSVTDVVVGLPISLDGTERAAAEGARSFAAEVAAHLGLAVHLVDERLSTTSATRALAATGAGGRRRRAVVDRSAATIILQAYLDALPRLPG